jgi:hypothetical protein
MAGKKISTGKSNFSFRLYLPGRSNHLYHHIHGLRADRARSNAASYASAKRLCPDAMQCILGVFAMLLPSFLKSASIWKSLTNDDLYTIFLYCAIYLGEVRISTTTCPTGHHPAYLQRACWEPSVTP